MYIVIRWTGDYLKVGNINLHLQGKFWILGPDNMYELFAYCTSMWKGLKDSSLCRAWTSIVKLLVMLLKDSKVWL